MVGESPTSGVHIYTLTITVLTLTVLVPVNAESGNWQPVNNCGESTTAFRFDSSGYPRLSIVIDRQCSYGADTCRYDLNGDLGSIGECHGDCPPDCPVLKSDGDWDSLVIVARLPDNTCLLTVSAHNLLGDVMRSRAVQIVNDCNNFERLDVSGHKPDFSGHKPDISGHKANASGCTPTMDALPMLRSFQSLIITLFTLVITTYIWI